MFPAADPFLKRLGMEAAAYKDYSGVLLTVEEFGPST